MDIPPRDHKFPLCVISRFVHGPSGSDLSMIDLSSEDINKRRILSLTSGSMYSPYRYLHPPSNIWFPLGGDRLEDGKIFYSYKDFSWSGTNLVIEVGKGPNNIIHKQQHDLHIRPISSHIGIHRGYRLNVNHVQLFDINRGRIEVTNKFTAGQEHIQVGMPLLPNCALIMGTQSGCICDFRDSSLTNLGDHEEIHWKTGITAGCQSFFSSYSRRYEMSPSKIYKILDVWNISEALDIFAWHPARGPLAAEFDNENNYTLNLIEPRRHNISEAFRSSEPHAFAPIHISGIPGIIAITNQCGTPRLLL